MAVYTDVGDEALENFLAAYDLGEVTAFKGIAEGVENSNYILQTTRGGYILTLYEKRVNASELPYFLDLMHHLSAKGLPCPLPVARRDGTVLGTLEGREAALFTFLSGVSVRRPTAAHCAECGRSLAQMHLAAIDYKGIRPNALSAHDWRSVLAQGDKAQVMAACENLWSGCHAFVEEQLTLLETQWPLDLPRGTIHADLFPNNVLFLGETLSGLIDFYFASTDMLAYDLAICLNAWCFEGDGSFNVTKSRAMIAAYETVRPLLDREVEALPLLARGAAMRFFVTRMVDSLNVPAGALVKPLDPREYAKKLRFHALAGSSAAYGVEARS
jgi:homoserine kinase type II